MADPASALVTPDHAGVKVPPPLLYVAILGVAFVLQRLVPLASWPRMLGIVLALPCLGVGTWLCGWAIVLFRRAHTSLLPIVPSSSLVAQGPYRLTRNPMYLGLALIYTGIALWLQLSWGVLLLPIVLALVYYLVIVREERYLLRRFGSAYEQYRKQVRRWL